MGLFDWIRCKHPLPDGFTGDAKYQTKDTDAQYMEDYTIREDGALIHHTVRREATPEDKLPNRHEPKGSILRLRGAITLVPIGDVEVPFHGCLCFYADTADGVREYEALYDRGKLLKIEGGILEGDDE